MKVTLLNYTTEALDLLLFTKSTRLGMSPKGMDEIRAWPAEKKESELRYMLGTIRSSWEFVDYVFLIEEVTRAFTHQLVRHRVGVAFAQQAQRVVNMRGFGYLVPPGLDDEQRQRYDQTMRAIDDGYRDLVGLGVNAQDARGVLPTNIHTNITMKINLRALNGLLAERLCVKAQGEFQDVARLLREEVLKVHPWTEPFLRVYCASSGTCMFANLPMTECPVKPIVYDPQTQEAYGGGKPGSLDEIQAHWQANRSEVQPKGSA